MTIVPLLWDCLVLGGVALRHDVVSSSKSQIWSMVFLTLMASCAVAADESLPAQEAIEPTPQAVLADNEVDATTAEGGTRAVATSYQPQPAVLPPQQLQPATTPSRAQENITSRWLGGLSQSLLTTSSGAGLGKDVIFGAEARGRVTTDAGSLLDKSPAALGLGIQRRTPIVTDPRIRGGRVGQLAASGSYWIPARIDLDTALSKIDSRLIDKMEVIKGPYAVRYGPGFHFVDVELLPSPRFEDGPRSLASTSLDYKFNGEQVYGRQSVWAGADNWGARFNYGHRTGNDYTTGLGAEVPSSYKSRDADLALGYDVGADDHIEFNYLRLDQTDVEYPGQAFDIDVLVTDGYELSYVSTSAAWCDRLVLDTWYNRTWFNGNAQRAGKRQQFPIYDFFRYVGFTDVDSTSLGFRLASSWGDEDEGQFTAGVDLRYLKQELNEIASGRIGFNLFQDANSPIPRSQSTNPGVFVEESVDMTERWSVVVGARADLNVSQVIEDPQDLEYLGLQQPQSSFSDIVGTDDWDRSVGTWSLFLNSRYELDPHVSVLGAVGHGERPPSLTELYAAQPFMFLLQNGLNTITGDPRLSQEKVTQFDLGMNFSYPRLQAGVNGFYTIARDYITFENLNVFRGPPVGNVEQVNLKYVNTELATFVGAEVFGQYDLTPWLSPFATLRYVEGTDRTRNGKFATRRASPGVPSERSYGMSRGAYSGIVGPEVEPLPGIPPLESRLGLRLHPAQTRPAWMVELSARVVDNQDLVATSLLESPTPGFTVFDIRGYWEVTDRLFLTAGIENFADRGFREHLDFRNADGLALYQPGITAYLGSELTY